MPSMKVTQKKILGFGDLPNGWHYGGGVPITEQSAGVALAILDKLTLMGFINTDAFPGIRGDVQVTAYDQSDFYEFNVELDGTVTVLYERNGEELSYDEKLSLSATLLKIQEFAFEQCDQSGLSTQTISTPTVIDFQVWRSETPQTAAEYPLSIVSAPKLPPEKFAFTSASFTPV